MVPVAASSVLDVECRQWCADAGGARGARLARAIPDEVCGALEPSGGRERIEQ